MLKTSKCVICGSAFSSFMNRETCSPVCHDKHVVPPAVDYVIKHDHLFTTIFDHSNDEGELL